MDSFLDAQFRRRISAIENNLISLERSTIDDFNHQWIAYTDGLKAALEKDPQCLSESTVTMAYALANRVHAVIQTFLELEELSERLMASLLTETSTELDLSEPIVDSSDSSLPSYIKPSYEWLVKNVHNPYPTTSARDSIARKSGSTRKEVDNWFIDARKRVGWNAARKTHFSNKRVEIVNAATRFYADDEKLSLSQDAELALVAIMKNVKDLYSDKFDQSLLASKLATFVKDLTPQAKEEAKAERLRLLQLKKDRDAYPSPDRSPEPTRLSLVPCDADADNATSQAISTVSRKRRSPSVGADGPEQSEGHRPTKRSRSDGSPNSSLIPISLPSPALSIDETLQVFEPTVTLSASSPTPTVPGRKRRLSESDGQGALKRPHNISAAPPLQAVSGAIPLFTNLLFDESSFDGWFQQTFDYPKISETSPSSFSVELGNLSNFDCDTPAVTRSATPENTQPAEQTFQPPTIEADISAVLDTQWSGGIDFWTDQMFAPSNSASSGLLVNFADHQALPASLAQDLANFPFLSQGSHSSNDFESLYSVSNVNTAVTPLVPTSSEVWEYRAPALTSQDAIYDFGKYDGRFTGILTSYDDALGIGLLSSPDPIYLPTLLQDKVRQEKEKEYREAMDKANRLALELQEEGVVSFAHGWLSTLDA
ncbi:hypothetical protein H0H87_012451 [Tephrocybe sp. NHM501043]|nr:hypothetical protein H0H87_012451 [Tephrocybe sp. NHM501043]